jgi:DNA (cytosine-5)-methyltransferase 1
MDLQNRTDNIESEQITKISTSLDTSPSAKAKIPLLSFFSGAGFLDIGFMQEKFDIVWRNEHNLSFAKGFEYAMSQMNLSGDHGKVHNTCSIADLSAQQIAREAFHNLPKPNIFGVIGGPPCPDFSNGGKNRGYEGDHGKLSQVYIDLIINLQPTFFLFENVPGLIDQEKHRHFLRTLIGQLSKDYLVDLNLLNALEYGVPQDRERLFLIGFSRKWMRKNRGIETANESSNCQAPLLSIKKDQRRVHSSGYNWFLWPKPLYTQAKIKYDWPAKSPFGEYPEKPMGIPDELMIGTYIAKIEDTSKLPNGLDGFKPKSTRFNLIAEGDVSGKSFKRLHRWRYSPAAAYGNNEVHLHPAEPRRLTVREALKIQTVPDIYAFPPDQPLSHKFKMIGNGVPVKLAQAIATSFTSFFE